VTEQTSGIEQVMLRIRELLRTEEFDSQVVRIARNESLYRYGDCDENVYLLESGIIKVLLPWTRGRECLIDVYTGGEIFGELSLCGQIQRAESTVAMQDSVVKKISSRTFLGMLQRKSLLEGLVQYLASRFAEQQRVITELLRVTSEQRLATLLLHLGRKMGKKDPRSLRIEQRLSHSELAKMAAATRPQVCIFLKRFRELGLIEVTAEQHLIVREHEILRYLFARRIPH